MRTSPLSTGRHAKPPEAHSHLQDGAAPLATAGVQPAASLPAVLRVNSRPVLPSRPSRNVLRQVTRRPEKTTPHLRRILMNKVDKSSNQAANDSRRRFFATAGGAIGAVVIANALPQIAGAADLPHLTLDDPTAKALNYTEDASKAGAPHQAG